MFFSFLKDPIKENRGVFSETFSRHLLFVFRFLFFLSFFLFFFAQFQSPRIALDLKDGCAPERRVSVLFFFCFFFSLSGGWPSCPVLSVRSAFISQKKSVLAH